MCDDQTIEPETAWQHRLCRCGEIKTAEWIVHPKVKEWIRKKQEEEQRAGTKLFIIEAALLLEDHYEEICDELWYIRTPEQCGEGVSGKAGNIRMSGSKELCRIRSQKHSF